MEVTAYSISGCIITVFPCRSALFQKAFDRFGAGCARILGHEPFGRVACEQTNDLGTGTQLASQCDCFFRVAPAVNLTGQIEQRRECLRCIEVVVECLDKTRGWLGLAPFGLSAFDISQAGIQAIELATSFV